jgi:phosphocarrier protein
MLMVDATVEIINKLGLHARAASKLANLAGSFNSKITIQKNQQTADGKGLMSLMLLAAGKGTIIRILCDGSDESAALDAMTTLIANRFNEAE